MRPAFNNIPVLRSSYNLASSDGMFDLVCLYQEIKPVFHLMRIQSSSEGILIYLTLLVRHNNKMSLKHLDFLCYFYINIIKNSSYLRLPFRGFSFYLFSSWPKSKTYFLYNLHSPVLSCSLTSSL